MKINITTKRITYLLMVHLFLFGVIVAIRSINAEDDPVYRDGVCIDHCEEDEEEEDDDEEDKDESGDDEKEDEKTANETYTITEPARTVTNTVMKTRIVIDTDQDGIPDGEDPHPDIAEIYVVSDDDRDGISDWLEK